METGACLPAKKKQSRRSNPCLYGSNPSTVRGTSAWKSFSDTRTSWTEFVHKSAFRWPVKALGSNKAVSLSDDSSESIFELLHRSEVGFGEFL